MFSTKMLKLKKRSQTQRAARIKMLVQARRHGDNLVADGGARLNNFSDVGLTNPTDHCVSVPLAVYLPVKTSEAGSTISEVGLDI